MSNRIIDELRAMMAGTPQAAVTTDPRAKALEMMRRTGPLNDDPDVHGYQGDVYEGQRSSPDLPSRRDVEYMNQNPTDEALQGYVDKFGFERMKNPQGPPLDYVPMPRERYPDLDPNNPIGPASLTPEEMARQGADFRPQDLDRVRASAGETNAATGAPENGDEEMMNYISKNIGGRDVDKEDFPWEGKEAPLPEDIEFLRANPDQVDSFIEVYGKEFLPKDFQQPDEEDDYRDTRSR